MTKYDLYELCVQNPKGTVRFLEAVHGGRPTTLREDFSGGAAICRAWAATGRPAIAVDEAAAPLRRARAPGVTVVRADVRTPRNKADIIAALNFPLGYWHTRAELVDYLRRSRSRLRPKGVFIADTYGGASSLTVESKQIEVIAPGDVRITYTWDQQSVEPLTGRVFNAIHFSVRDGDGPARAFKSAFTYDWRLWTVTELRDAYAEAGFTRTDVYDQTGGAMDHLGRLHVLPLREDEELGGSFVVYVVGRG